MRRRNHRGETLAETIAALLIIALSAALLFTGIGAAARLNLQIDARTGTKNEARVRAETQTGPAESAVVTVRYEDEETLTLPVDIYGGPEGPASYREVEP